MSLDEMIRDAAMKEVREIAGEVRKEALRALAEDVGPSLVVPKDFVDARQGAEYLGMDVGDFRDMAAKGEWPQYRFSERRIRYYLPDLRAWGLAQRVR